MTIPKSRKKLLDETMGKINKKYGANVVNFASQKEDELKVKFLKTPSYEVNLMLGGGIAVGRTIEFFGDNSSGKTSMVYEIIAYQQRLNPEFTVAWYETEGSYDPEYARMLGVDTDRIIYWDQTQVTAEDGFEVLRGMIQSKGCELVVINSISGLLTHNENEKDMSSLSIGELAKLMSKLMRVITGPSSKTKTTVIFINQIREKVGVMFGSPETTSGGRAIGFYASQRIRFSKHKVEKADPITEETGIKIHCKVIKNRVAKGNPYKQCDYYAVYGKGIDYIAELPEILSRENIVRRAGSWIYYENENGEPLTIGGTLCKWNSKSAFLSELRKNKELKKLFEQKIDELMENGTTRGVGLSKEEINEIEQQDEKDKEELKEIASDDFDAFEGE